MNVVLDDCDEIYVKKNIRRKIGRIILKGDNIALICNISEQWKHQHKPFPHLKKDVMASIEPA